MRPSPETVGTDNAAPSSGKRRILLLTPEIEGPTRNGGVGTAFTALAHLLARAGHDVTILYTGIITQKNGRRLWADHYAAQGLRFIPFLGPTDGINTRKLSWRLFDWLKTRDHFDIIYHAEWHGGAFYALAAREAGLHFLRTTFVAVAHGPSSWTREGNLRLPGSIEDLQTDFLEQRCVAMADVLISPSRYMLDWIRRHHWDLPARAEVIPNCLPEFPPIPAAPAEPPGGRAEIVFFGRLEERKGLALFCDALDRLDPAAWEKIGQVSFLGKPLSDLIPGKLRERAKAWPAPLALLTGLDRVQANAYLSQPGRIAVIPPLVENSPYVVIESLMRGKPFIATKVGGIPELVAPEDHEKFLFEPRPQALVDTLLRLLDDPAAPAPAPALEARKIADQWLNLTNALPVFTRQPRSLAAPPFISVCLIHHDRPHYLKEAIQSLERQSYAHFEIVLVDDGSRKKESHAFLETLEPDFARRGWRVIRSENRYLGAARNLAAKHARGEYLLFMDDDNIALSAELATFARAARYTDADILTTAFLPFFGDKAPDYQLSGNDLYYPLGACLAASVYRNCFGDANALVRRSTFDRLGGFTEDYGIGHEDWEFFANASLQGVSFSVIPEVLFLYRSNRTGMLKQTDAYKNHARNIRPYIQHLPGQMGNALAYALQLSMNEQRESKRAFGLLLQPRLLRRILKIALSNKRLCKLFWTVLREEGPVAAIRNVVLYMRRYPD